MQRISIDLSDLDIHHLDADPREAEHAIEVELRATINGVDESTISQLAGNALRPEELVVSVADAPVDEELNRSDSQC